MQSTKRLQRNGFWLPLNESPLVQTKQALACQECTKFIMIFAIGVLRYLTAFSLIFPSRAVVYAITQILHVDAGAIPALHIP